MSRNADPKWLRDVLDNLEKEFFEGEGEEFRLFDIKSPSLLSQEDVMHLDELQTRLGVPLTEHVQICCEKDKPDRWYLAIPFEDFLKLLLRRTRAHLRVCKEPV